VYYHADVKRILVAGATGETGRRCVTKLQARGLLVRVLSRDADRARSLFGDVEVHRGDVRDPGSLTALSEGVDGAICTIGTRSYFGDNGGQAVDAIGTRNFAAACDQLPHLVFLSAFGLDRKSWGLSVFSAVLNQYFRWKAEAEAAVRGCGVPYTIVRPVELRNRPARSAALLNQTEPLSLLRTVSRDLVAEVLVECLGKKSAIGKTFELCEGGSGDLATQLDAMLPDGARPLPSRTPLV
jgi:uncharacterized protein YbjT (DUF2867 family)